MSKDNVKSKQLLCDDEGVNKIKPINHIDRLLPDEVLALVVDLIPLSDRILKLRLVSHRWKEVTELACRSSVHRLVLLGRKAINPNRDEPSEIVSHGHLISTHLESYGFEDSEHCNDGQRRSLYRSKYAHHELKLSSNQALQRRSSCAQILALFPSVRSLWLITVCFERQFDELAHLLRHWGPKGLTELKILSHPPWCANHSLYRFISTVVTQSTLPHLRHLTLDNSSADVEYRVDNDGRPNDKKYFNFNNLPVGLHSLHLIGLLSKLYDDMLVLGSPSKLFQQLTALSLPETLHAGIHIELMTTMATKVFPSLAELTCYLNPFYYNFDETRHFESVLPLIDRHCSSLGRLTSLRLRRVRQPLFWVTQRLPRLADGLRRLRLDYDLGQVWFAGNEYRYQEDVDFEPEERVLIYPRLELFHLYLWSPYGQFREVPSNPTRTYGHLRRIFPSLRTEVQDSTDCGQCSMVFLHSGQVQQAYPDLLREHQLIFSKDDKLYYTGRVLCKDSGLELPDLGLRMSPVLRHEWRRLRNPDSVSQEEGIELFPREKLPVVPCSYCRRMVTLAGLYRELDPFVPGYYQVKLCLALPPSSDRRLFPLPNEGNTTEEAK